MPARPAHARGGQGARRSRRHAPPRRGGGWLCLQGGSPPVPEHERRGARALGGELQAPRGNEPEAGDLADDGSEPALAQPLLEDGKDVRLVPGLDEDDAVRVKARGRKARCEEVPPVQAPQHGPAEPRRQASREENGRSALLARRSGLQDLMDRPARKPPRRQVSVDGCDPERDRVPLPPLRPLQPCDARP